MTHAVVAALSTWARARSPEAQCRSLLRTVLVIGAIFFGALGAQRATAGEEASSPPPLLAAPAVKKDYYVPDVPADMAQVDFYLITVGVGDEIANRFGHTGIRVADHVNQTDVVFNWGTFRFDDAGFLWKFFRGELVYTMGIRSFAADKARHDHDERAMWMEPLNLSSKQKRKLLEKIAWNAVPEHRDFQYQYWFKNCSTIPRDYLDEVLDGQVRARFGTAKNGYRFRDFVRRNLATVPFVVPSLDIIMNSNIDRPITAWEEMFLPSRLHDFLKEMPAIDDEGGEVGGKRLLGETVTLTSYGEVFEAPFNDYAAFAALGALPLVAAFGLFVKGGQRGASMGVRFLGVACILWGIFSFAFGTTLALDWALSGHPDTWHDANLLLFWPFDIIFVWLGVKLLKTGRPVNLDQAGGRVARFLVIGHVVALALLVICTSASAISQDVWRVIVAFGTVTLALGAAVWWRGMDPPAVAGAGQ